MSHVGIKFSACLVTKVCNSLQRNYLRDIINKLFKIETRGRGRSRKTWEQCVRDDMKLLGLYPEWAVFRDMWRNLIWGKRLTLA